MRVSNCYLTSVCSASVAEIETGKLQNNHIAPPQFMPQGGYTTRAGKMAACLLNQAQVVMHNHYIQSVCLRGLSGHYHRPCLKHNDVKQLVSQIPACCCGDVEGCTFVGHLNRLFTWEEGCQRTLQPVYDIITGDDLLDYSSKCTEHSDADYCKRGMLLAVKAMKGLMTAAKKLYTLVPADETSLAKKFIGVCDSNEPYKTCGAKALSYFSSAEWALHENHLNHVSSSDADTLQESHSKFQCECNLCASMLLYLLCDLLAFCAAMSVSANGAASKPTPYSTAREPAPPGDDDGNPHASGYDATREPTPHPTLRPTLKPTTKTLYPTPWHARDDNNYGSGGEDDDWIANLGKSQRAGHN